MPLTPLNLDKLQLWIDIGRIDPSKPIDLKVLYDSGVAQKFKHGVKLLANVRDFLSFVYFTIFFLLKIDTISLSLSLSLYFCLNYNQ